MPLATYESMVQLIETCDKAYRAGRRYNWKEAGASWTGRHFDTWEGIKEACVQPWPEGLNIVQHMMYMLERESLTLPPPVDRRRRKIWSEDTGDELDKDRLMSGQPYWLATERTFIKGPQHLTVISDATAGCKRSAESILWRGAATVILADLLEKNGYRTELWVANKSRGAYKYCPNRQDTRMMRMKESADPLDISDVTNMVSGWFFRTILGLQAAHIPADVTPAPGYGHPVPLSKEDEDIKQLAGPTSGVVIIDHVWTMVDALNKVKEVVKAINDGTLIREEFDR